MESSLDSWRVNARSQSPAVPPSGRPCVSALTGPRVVRMPIAFRELPDATSTEKDEPPDDFAYDPTDGYKGLLLHYASPTLAARVYPLLARPKVLRRFTQLQIVVATVALPPLYIRQIPIGLAHILFVLYLQSLYRILLLDLRVLWLQLKQFETQFLLVTWLLAILTFTGAAEYPLIPFNLLATSTDCVFLDALRFPPADLLELVVFYMGGWWLTLLTLAYEVMLYNDYEKGFSGHVLRVRYISFSVGRCATLAIFWSRYALKQWLRPGSYAILREPVRSDCMTASSIPRVAPTGPSSDQVAMALATRPNLSPSLSDLPSPRPTVSDTFSASDKALRHIPHWESGDLVRPFHTQSLTQSVRTSVLDALTTHLPSRLRSPTDGLVLQWASPRLASFAYPILRSKPFGYLMDGAAVLGVVLVGVSILVVPQHHNPLACVYWSLFLLHSSSQLSMLDVRLFKQLIKHFETWFLIGNLVALWLCLLDPQLFSHEPRISVEVALVGLVSGFGIFVDALRLPLVHKASQVLWFGIILCALSALPSASWPAVAQQMNYETKLWGMDGVPTASYASGRLLTLGIFYCKSALLLWWWPDRFVVLHLPLQRTDRRVFQVRSLQELPPVSLPATLRPPGMC